MESIIDVFQLDLKLFIAQIVNFAIVFSVLYFFILKPLLKTMADRSETIAKSLDNAKDIDNRLVQTQKEVSQIVSDARKEASEIVAQAKKDSEAKRASIIEKAKEDVGQIINQEKAKIQQEKAEVLKEVKKEVAELVILALEKVVGNKFSSEHNKEMIKKIVEK